MVSRHVLSRHVLPDDRVAYRQSCLPAEFSRQGAEGYPMLHDGCAFDDIVVVEGGPTQSTDGLVKWTTKPA